MYRVTIYNSSTATIIHEASTDPAEPHLYSCTLTEGASGSIDSLEFTILPNNPGYELLNSRYTMIAVLNTRTDIAEFQGRILTITPQMDNSGMVYKTVVCESRLGFLCDSIQPYTEEATYALEDFFALLLENHNSQVEDYKKIYPGNVSVTASASTGNVTKALNYETTWEALKSKLLDTEGGEIQIYTGTDGLMYLDYVDQLGSTKDQTIELGKNMKSISQEIDPTSIITRLIPLGAKLEDEDGNDTEERLTVADVNGGVIYLDDEDAQEVYGIVEGVVEWDDVTVADNLLTKAQAWLDSQTVIDSVTIDALDLWLLGLEEDALERYNYYRITNSAIGLDAYFRVVKRTVDICDPSNITYELGSQDKTVSSTIASASSNAQSAADDVAAVNATLSKTVVSLVAANAEITDLTARVATIEEAYISTLEVDTLLADYIKTEDLEASVATFGYVKADELEADIAEFGYVKTDYLTTNYLTADDIESKYATISTLEANYITADTIESTYIRADLTNFTATMVGTLLANTGVVTNMSIENGYVTGELSSVTINADLITAGTLSVERLIMTGSDGLIYQINLESSGLTVSELSDETYQNYLNGTVIVAKSVTADQIAAGTITATEIAANTITADEMNVSELSAISENVGILTAGILQSQNYAEGESGIYIDLNTGTIDCESLLATAEERILLSVEDVVAASLVLEVAEDADGTRYGALSANASYIVFNASEIAIYTDDFTLENGSATFSGALAAASGTFTGELVAATGTIANWTIGEDKIYNSDGAANGTAVMQAPSSDSTYVFAAGGSSHDDYSDCPFRVTKEGKLYARDGIFENAIYMYDDINNKTWEMLRANGAGLEFPQYCYFSASDGVIFDTTVGIYSTATLNGKLTLAGGSTGTECIEFAQANTNLRISGSSTDGYALSFVGGSYGFLFTASDVTGNCRVYNSLTIGGDLYQTGGTYINGTQAYHIVKVVTATLSSSTAVADGETWSVSGTCTAPSTFTGTITVPRYCNYGFPSGTFNISTSDTTSTITGTYRNASGESHTCSAQVVVIYYI